jgi:hypothetical protein
LEENICQLVIWQKDNIQNMLKTENFKSKTVYPI